MKIGMSSLACPAWTVEQVADAAQSYGYDGVELRLLDGETITPALVRTNLARLQQVFGPGKPALAGLGSSVRFTAASASERAAQEHDLLELIELAQELDAPLVRVFGGKIPDGESVETAVANVAASFQRCAGAAERAGVLLGLETHDDFCRSAAVAQVLAQVESRAVGAIWDTHHPYRMGDSVATVWTNLADRLIHVHVKDARRRADGGWDLVLLGEGEVPNREVVRALAMRGYDGWVSAEWEKKWHPEIEEPEIALPQHRAKLREWLADVS